MKVIKIEIMNWRVRIIEIELMKMKNKSYKNWRIIKWRMRIIKIELIKMKNENDEKWIERWKL